MFDIGVFAYLRGLFFQHNEEIGRKGSKSTGSYMRTQKIISVVDTEELGFAVTPDEDRDIAEVGINITDAATEQLGFHHP